MVWSSIIDAVKTRLGLDNSKNTRLQKVSIFTMR